MNTTFVIGLEVIMRRQLYNFPVTPPPDKMTDRQLALIKQSYYNMPDTTNQMNHTSPLFGDGRDIELASDIVFNEFGWFLL